MAYRSFAEQPDVILLERPEGVRSDAARPAARRAVGTEMQGFSALEWSVVALAERDRLTSLRVPGRVAMAMGVVFGDRRNPRLADARLEALRRMAVLSWHHGFAVHGNDVRDFTAAGYTLDQYETLVASIGAAKARRPRRRSAQ